MIKWLKSYVNQIISNEISIFSKYYDKLVYWTPIEKNEEDMVLYNEIENKNKIIIKSSDDPKEKMQRSENDKVIFFLKGLFNHNYDIQGLLKELFSISKRSDRVVSVIYNPYYRWLYFLVNKLGIRKGELPTTFITYTDLHNLCKISGFEVVKARPCVYFPFKLFGLGILINKLMPTLNFFNFLSLVTICTLRPMIKSEKRPSLTIIIPAMNEKGNIENALKRLPDLNCEMEVIYVEGHSKDNTWEEIQRVVELYKDKFKLQAYQQTGKGKNDAVRLGFSKATGDLLTILDADLTMPPELLGRFYDAYVNGQGDFINGNRLTYPMEGEAMRFLNHLGNIFFAKALSYVLCNPLGDSLCGTKLLSKSDYQRVLAWRDDFGDFDPFGDYELLFPASILNLGIVDIPIRYRDRTYGSTNIHRFRHGFMLLKMTMTGLLRVKLGK